MIKIDILKNCPKSIPVLTNIWHEGIGKIWLPEIKIDKIESLYYEELNQNMPLTFVALSDEFPVGSCTIQLNDEIRPDLGPWISDLVIAKNYRKQGIGKMLINNAITKIIELGFKELYVFTFDLKTANYYKNLGWEKIGKNKFKSYNVIIMKKLL